MNMRINIFLTISIVLLFSCASQKSAPTVDNNLVIFPAPPDPTRIQFLTSFSNSVDITGERGGFAKLILGKENTKPIIKPYGIAIHDGKIYIADTILGGLEIIDLETSSFKYFQPDGLGKIKKPINCHIDENGFLYVADAKRKQVVMFDENLNFVRAFGDPSEMKPTDIFEYENEIWLCDMRGHKIHIYDKENGQLLRSLPIAEENTPEFLFSPSNITIANDYLYVSDFGDFKIKVYDLDGKFIRSIGSYGRVLGQFVRPKGVAVDQENNLYVVDSGFENVQIFNDTGELLLFFGGTYEKQGDMWLPAKVVIDYENLEYFQKYVHKSFNLKYLIFVTNQYGPDKINVYGFVEPKSLD